MHEVQTFDRKAVFAISVLTMMAVTGAQAQDRVVSPESLGFSTAGLNEFQRTMRALVDEGSLAGITTLVARHGKVVHFDAYGVQSLASKKPVTKDTIFRIASMTKPIVGTAMMMLWEQGQWTLDDPVAKHIPEFANLKVATLKGEVPQSKPMTMRQLMSHTAGLDVDAAYLPSKLLASDLQGMIRKLSTMPLVAQPGTDWRYGPSVDVQAYLVQKLSGQPLDQFLRTRIFEPLGMKDTGFWVEPEKLHRRTDVFTYGPDKKLMQSTPAPGFYQLVESTARPTYFRAVADCFPPPKTISGSRR